MLFDHQHAIVAQRGMARRRQPELIGGGVALVWPRRHIQRQGQIAGAAGHWADNREVDGGGDGKHWRPGRRETAHRRHPMRWLMREDAAEVCRGAKRTREIGAVFERDVSGRQGRRRPARGSARRLREIPGFVVSP